MGVLNAVLEAIDDAYSAQGKDFYGELELEVTFSKNGFDKARSEIKAKHLFNFSPYGRDYDTVSGFPLKVDMTQEELFKVRNKQLIRGE